MNITPVASSPRILIVHHHQPTLDDIENSLDSANHTHLTLTNTATKALSALRKLPIDLLILAADTPDMDGWRLARLVRSGILECRTDLPIIIMTNTWCERIAEITAREYGINYLLAREHLHLLPSIVDELQLTNQGNLPKPRLLIVEDEPDTANLIKRVLSGAFTIEIAVDGIDGLNAWQEGNHDLVLLDVMLPRLSGRDVLIEIQRIDPTQPVVIMTAHTTIDQAEELMLLGAVDFLPKPFRAEQLRKVCDIALRREDFLVSNAQFAAHVESLQSSEQALRHLYENHHQLLENLQAVVMELDDTLTIRYLNRTWETLLGFSIKESLGRPLDDFIALEDAHPFWRFKENLNAFQDGSQHNTNLELCLTNKQKQKIWTQLRISHSLNEHQDARFTVCLDNITERRQAQEKLKKLANHDSLTGLYNRHYFETSLAKLTEDALRTHHRHGLIYIDLDHFKIINDAHGHQKGDELLCEIGRMLSLKVRQPNILCRLGGDEFAVLMRNLTHQNIQTYALDLQKTINDFSIEAQGKRVSLSCSIGISLIDSGTKKPEEHLRRADIALYVAKGRGRNLIHQYNPQDKESDKLRQHVDVVHKMRKAIQEDRLVLYFQPIFDVYKNKISYYEALVRMIDENGKIIPPNEFIPALEAAGEMYMLDRWIIKLAIRNLQQYTGLQQIAINLSAQAFRDENLVPTIVENLANSGVKAERITFELTESDSLFNLEITKHVIDELHQLGCSFSVDDFGSGFSNFTYLKELPADYIKLDGSFIKNLHKDKIDQQLVRSIIQVIQALGKKAVAEFVENEEILQLLKTMNVDFVQGYHIGHPLPVSALPELNK